MIGARVWLEYLSAAAPAAAAMCAARAVIQLSRVALISSLRSNLAIHTKQQQRLCDKPAWQPTSLMMRITQQTQQRMTNLRCRWREDNSTYIFLIFKTLIALLINVFIFYFKF